jgi:hypothetical protein
VYVGELVALETTHLNAGGTRAKREKYLSRFVKTLKTAC